MTINWIRFIEPEEFIQQVLEKSAQAYLCLIIVIENYPFQIYLSQMAQISFATTKPVIIPETYKDLKNLFSTKNAGHLPMYKNHHHAINLVHGKQSHYGPIYSLSKNELSILWAYIDKNLANEFIRPSKSPAYTSILLVLKPDRGLRLCVNYRGLNSLTIKNRYIFFFFGKFFEFTKLDFTDVYYWIRIKKGDK